VQFCIYTHGIDLTETIKRQTYEKLDLALDRFEDDIEHISVFLVDTNGPLLGGIDKSCRIVVLIRKQESIVVEDIDENVDVVLDRITDRLGVVASQRADNLKRSRKRYRSSVDADDVYDFNW
jgi:hypothetical protein